MSEEKDTQAPAPTDEFGIEELESYEVALIQGCSDMSGR